MSPARIEHNMLVMGNIEEINRQKTTSNYLALVHAHERWLQQRSYSESFLVVLVQNAARIIRGRVALL